MVETKIAAESITDLEEVKQYVEVLNWVTAKVAPSEILNLIANSGALYKGHFRFQPWGIRDQGFTVNIALDTARYFRADNIFGLDPRRQLIQELLTFMLQAGGVTFDRIATPQTSSLWYEEDAGKVCTLNLDDKTGIPTTDFIGTKPFPNDRVLLVDDAIMMGRTMRTMMEASIKCKANPVAMATLAVADQETLGQLVTDFELPVIHIARVNLDPYYDEFLWGRNPHGVQNNVNCKLCKEEKELMSVLEL